MTASSIDHLSRKDFQRLASFIHDYSGIKMPPTKQTMVEGRLRKRLKPTGCANLADYCRYVFDGDGLQTETIHLIDVVTTNKTDFFREPEHFRFLQEFSIPQLVAARRTGSGAPVKIWSTASSIGAEPYTLAMVMADLGTQFNGLRDQYHRDRYFDPGFADRRRGDLSGGDDCPGAA